MEVATTITGILCSDLIHRYRSTGKVKVWADRWLAAVLSLDNSILKEAAR